MATIPRHRLLSWRLVVALLLASDFVLVLLGLTFAYALRFNASWLITNGTEALSRLADAVSRAAQVAPLPAIPHVEPPMSDVSLLGLVPLAVVWLVLFA